MPERCPIGAPHYDDGEDCIGCCLCFAMSREELTEAQEKLNKYLKMSPKEREDFMRKDAYFKEN
jgi:hypothetical protein